MASSAVDLTSVQGASAPLGSRAPKRVVLVGNPNVGKTTLFNALTGQNARVGNYPGITVECRSARLRRSRDSVGPAVEVVDVPGTYSLSARSAEEQIALSAVVGIFDEPRPDLVVVVVDAGQLVRNLYLVTQLLELRVPLVIALNMLDEVADNPPEPEAIERFFNVPCVATNGASGQGMKALAAAIEASLAHRPEPRIDIRYPASLRPVVDRVAEALPARWRRNVEHDRALASWALTSIEPDDELAGIPAKLRKCVEAVRSDEPSRDIDAELIETRYRYLDAHTGTFYRRDLTASKKQRASDRVDRVLLHPVLGLGIFVLVMLGLFQALFSGSDPAISAVEDAFGALAAWVQGSLPEGWARDLLTEGVIGGVGNVVVFLPQILLLFLFIGLLEDSGYMARVAYLMDRVMRTLGLHGRAFVPMLSGFACAVPAILSTRTMERRRDRLLTMLVVPLMTCSARLPVYTLIIAALFPPTALFGWLPVQGLLMVGMYVFSMLVSLGAAFVLSRTVVRGKRVGLILELPPYRVPRLGATLRMMWDRSSAFLKEAGTIILVCTIALWALLSFPAMEREATSSPPAAPVASVATAARLPGPAKATDPPQPIEYSYAGRLGKALEPALEPLGFDWRIGVGLIGAFAAREVFVSTMGLVYGIGEDVGDAPLRQRLSHQTTRDGKPAYTPLMGLSLLVFFALAGQCMSTMAVVRRETATWRWPIFLFGYMTALAYLASLLIYQGGRALGF